MRTYMDLHGVEKRKEKKVPRKPKPKEIKSPVSGILMALFIPPVSLAGWFGIFSFLTMVYPTAGGQ